MSDPFDASVQRIKNFIIDAKVVAIKDFSSIMVEALGQLNPGDLITPESVSKALQATAENYELFLLRQKP